MKKYICVLTTLVVLITVAFAVACGNGNGDANENSESSDQIEMNEYGNGNVYTPGLPVENDDDTLNDISGAGNGEPGGNGGAVVVGLSAYDPWGRPNFAADGTPLNQGIQETKMDLDGRVVRMLTGQYNWYQYRGDIDETGRNFLEFRRRWLQIEEDYNFVLELENVSGSVIERLISNRAAGLAEIDILNIGVNGVHQEQLILQNHIIRMCHPSIADVIRFEENPFHAESDLANIFGYQWGIHILKLQTNNLFRGVVTFNRNLMEDFNLPNFYDLFRTNEWTWDVFEQISRDFAAMGSRHVPIVQTGESSFVPHIIASNGGQLITRNADGTMTFVGHTDEATLEALYWTMTLIDDGLLRHGVDVSRFFDMGNALFIMGGYNNLRDRGSTGMINTDARVGLMPLPRGPRMDGFTTRTFSSAMFYVIDGIPSPDEVAAVLVAFANRWPRTDVIAHELAYALMDEESAEVMAYLLQVMDIDFSRTIGSARGPIGTASNSIILGNQTPVQAMQAIAIEVQAALDEAWEGFVR